MQLPPTLSSSYFLSLEVGQDSWCMTHGGSSLCSFSSNSFTEYYYYINIVNQKKKKKEKNENKLELELCQAQAGLIRWLKLRGFLLKIQNKKHDEFLIMLR